MKGTNEGDEGATYFVSSFNDQTPTQTAATYICSTFTYYVKTTPDAQDLHDTRLAAGGSLNVKVSYNSYDGGSPALVTGTGVLTSSMLKPEDPGVSPEEWEFIVTDFNGPKSPDNSYNEGAIFDPFDTTELLPGIIGPFVNPVQTEKMFFNIRFDRGLKNTVPIKVVVYELDSKGGSRTGISETFTVTYTEDTLDEVNRTFEINIANFDNATMLKVIMPATQVPTGRGVENKINIKGGQVKMPSYDVNTGQILPNAPSRKAADAILFLWIDFYKKDPAGLNLDELYAIQNRLDAINPEYAQFDYTYDDVETGLGQSIDIALNVMRANKYRDGQQVRFWRDEKETLPSTAIVRPDIAPESERDYSITKKMFVGSDKDSIQIEYIDRAINKKAYVYRSINSAGVIVNVAGNNPKKNNIARLSEFAECRKPRRFRDTKVAIKTLDRDWETHRLFYL